MADQAGSARQSVERLLGDVTAVFVAAGMSAADAHTVADSIVEADLRGVHSHGTALVPWYVDKLTTGGVDPSGRPRVVQDSAAAVVIDGGNAMGHVAARFAMDAAIERAGRFGVGVAVVRGSNHCGAMACYALQALDADMIGIAGTHAIPTMAPWDGLDRIVGANPLAIAIPAAAEAPFVFDGSFSQAARGKVALHASASEPIPENWAFDAEGNPTTDASLALEGLLAPIGGPKGVGLALAVGILSTALSGATYGTRLGSLESGARPGEDGHLFIALRIDAFVEPAEFGPRVDEVIDEIHRSRPREGTARVFVPGERASQRRAAGEEHGIALPESVVRGLRQVMEKLGVGGGRGTRPSRSGRG